MSFQKCQFNYILKMSVPKTIRQRRLRNKIKCNHICRSNNVKLTNVSIFDSTFADRDTMIDE